MSAQPLLDAVRGAAAWVAERAEHVRIDEAALRRYAAALPVSQITEPRSEPAIEAVGRDPELRAAFVVSLDCVNFGSGYFPLLRKPPGHSGYRTVEARLRDRFAAQGAFTASDLAKSTPQSCAALFQQEADGPVGELMARFAQAWRELGEHLQAAHGGSFLALAASAQGSAPRLVEELARLASYRDVARYRAREIPFLKRAQITAADLALALPELGFRDLERLTLFADNLVPHVLRLDGVLAYDSELLARIEREQPIEAGSAEEVEIRACALHAVERLCQCVRESGRALWPYQLDYWLWRRGGGPSYKARPRHRARSWFY